MGNDRQFAALAGLLGLDVEERFATNAGRVAARDDLVRVLEGALARGTVREWEERLGAVGIAASPVDDLPAALARAAALGLDPLVDGGPGGLPQVRHPVRYDGTAPAPPVAPPLLDQHGDEVRAWLADPGAGALPPLGR